MKLTAAEYDVTTEGIDSTTGFSIEANDPAIIEILTQKIYTDPHVFPRELMANAIDAGGIFELSVPDSMNPVWEVEDKGEGMDHEFMMAGYTRIFHSTKRKDNTNIGGFGHGRLSPLAYTDSYTVRSRFLSSDGIVMEGQYAVYRGPNKIPMITCVSMVKSEVQETGVRVVVPIATRDIGMFAARTQYFAQYLPGKIDGVTPVKYIFQNKEGGLRQTADVNTRNSYNSTPNTDPVPGSRLIIGGVPYPVPGGQWNWATSLALDLFFNVGELDVTLSRDAVNFTHEARGLIQKRFDAFRKEYSETLLADIKKQPTVYERYVKWHDLVQKSGYSFRDAFLNGYQQSSVLTGKEIMDTAKKDFAVHFLTSDVDRSQWSEMDDATKAYRSLSGLRVYMLADKGSVQRRGGNEVAGDIDFRNVLHMRSVYNASTPLLAFAVQLPYSQGQIKKIKEVMSAKLAAERTKSGTNISKNAQLSCLLIQYEDKADVQAILDKIMTGMKVTYIDQGAKAAKPVRYVPVSQYTPNGNWKEAALSEAAIGKLTNVLYMVREPGSRMNSNYECVGYMRRLPSLQGKSYIIIGKNDEKLLDKSAKPLKDAFIAAVAKDYGYEYNRKIFDQIADPNTAMQNTEIFYTLSLKVKSASGIGRSQLMDKLAKDARIQAVNPKITDLLSAVINVRDGTKQATTDYRQLREMLDIILAVSERYPTFMKKDELPKPTKSIASSKPVDNVAELQAFEKKFGLLAGLSHTYDVRYHGISDDQYEHIVQYLTKFN